MTPDIHTKTYVERSGLGGIASGTGGGGVSPGIQFQNSNMTGGAHSTAYGSIQQSGKTSKNLANHQQQLMGLTLNNTNNSIVSGVNNVDHLDTQ